MGGKQNEKSGFESYFLWVHHLLAYNTCEFYSIHLKWFLTCSQKVKGVKEFKMISRHPRFLRRQIQNHNEGRFSLRNRVSEELPLMNSEASSSIQLICVLLSVGSSDLPKVAFSFLVSSWLGQMQAGVYGSPLRYLQNTFLLLVYPLAVWLQRSQLGEHAGGRCESSPRVWTNPLGGRACPDRYTEEVDPKRGRASHT